MKQLNLSLIVFFGLLASTALGQTCTYTKLSNTFDFKTSQNKNQNAHDTDSCIVTVYVISKLTNLTLLTICFSTEFYLFKNTFVDCNNVRSYSTGINNLQGVVDNDFGDIIVADFNFDNKEDFAIKREEGGSSGPLYNYYIQISPTAFKLDKFLSEKMIWFPTIFNEKKKTLTTLVPVNLMSVYETTYKLDTLTNIWKEIDQRIIKD